MDRQPVQSSQIKAIGYDPATLKLEIEFQCRSDQTLGAVYEYDNVTPEVHEGFFKPDVSIGRYFHATIKNNPKAYPYKRIGEPR